MQSSRSSNPKLIIALVIAFAVLLANWRLVAGNSQRQVMNRSLDAQDIPASLALVTIAVGPLRGLIADVLWWRAADMQDRGNFFEAIQLADWISKLQPTMAMVWAYHGWNLSSNIVNETKNPAERWKWTLKGIELLRDEGLRYNPGNSDIRRELANIFLNRIGSQKDPFNDYYKRQWVGITLMYFESGKREELEAINEAPVSVDELRQVEGVQALLDAATGQGLDLLDPYTYHHPREWTAEQQKILSNPAYADAGEALRLYQSRRGIEDKLKMNLPRMLVIDHLYGPLDWRLWQAQTIYWAAADGLALDGEEPDEIYTSSMQEDAFIRQAMYSAFEDGTFVYVNDQRVITTNNLEILGQVDEFMHHAFEKMGRPDGAKNMMKSLHETAAVILYNYNYIEESREMYDALCEEFLSPEERQGMTFESFIIDRAYKQIEGSKPGDRQGMVVSLLYQAYMWLALGDGYKAKGYQNMARLVWATHQKSTKLEERKLPPFEDIQRVALDLATGPQSTLPPDLQETLIALRGDNPELAIKPTGVRPKIGLGDHHEHHD